MLFQNYRSQTLERAEFYNLQ